MLKELSKVAMSIAYHAVVHIHMMKIANGNNMHSSMGSIKHISFIQGSVIVIYQIINISHIVQC